MKELYIYILSDYGNLVILISSYRMLHSFKALEFDNAKNKANVGRYAPVEEEIRC